MAFDAGKFIGNVKAAGAKAQAAATRAMTKFGAHVVGDAQNLTPVDTGALQASGTWEDASESGGKITEVIGFNTNYAAAVHENLNANHSGTESKEEFKSRKSKNAARGAKTKHRNGVGQAKFLYTAMKNNQSKMGPFVAEQVKKAVEGGG